MCSQYLNKPGERDWYQYTLQFTLVSGAFATIDFPVLPGAASGDSVQVLAASFSASGVSSPFETTWTLTVLKADQTISGFTADPASGTIGGSSTLSATATSGLPVTFGSNTPAVCSVAGDIVSYAAVGTCTVTADQAGDSTYNPATQVTLDIAVAKADQVITNFISTPASGNVGDTTTLSATGGASGNPVTFGSNTLSVCTVAGNTVTLLACRHLHRDSGPGGRCKL